MHEGWRSELPDEIAEGTQIVGVARAKGLRNRVTWTVTTWDPPHEVAMSGSGKGGAKYAVTLSVRPTEEGSTLGLRLELGGRALFGPVGSAAARAVKGDVQKSLRTSSRCTGNGLRGDRKRGEAGRGGSPPINTDTRGDTPNSCRSAVIDWRPYERLVLRAPA
jgi:hypothetical protein